MMTARMVKKRTLWKLTSSTVLASNHLWSSVLWKQLIPTKSLINRSVKSNRSRRSPASPAPWCLTISLILHIN
uniref:Uncharacterized protein n=1 Tax=Arundo donax TaxID=35708 RepID=A0A0A9FL77_ARUDO